MRRLRSLAKWLSFIFLLAAVVKCNSDEHLCAGIVCKAKPEAGKCSPRNATTLGATQIYGEQRICCNVWACTHPNKTTTLHYGLSGQKIIKGSAANKTSPAGRSFFAKKSTKNETCHGLTCFGGQPSQNCRKFSPPTILSMFKLHADDCCPLWTCTFAGNSSQYYVHSGVVQTKSYWKIGGNGALEEDGVQKLSDLVKKKKDEEDKPEKVEKFELSIDSSYANKLMGISRISSSSCPSVHCWPPAKGMEKSCQSVSKPGPEIFKLLGHIESDCCPLYKCSGATKIYLLSFGHFYAENTTKVKMVEEDPSASMAPPTAHAQEHTTTTHKPTTAKPKPKGRSFEKAAGLSTTPNPNMVVNGSSTQHPINESGTTPTPNMQHNASTLGPILRSTTPIPAHVQSLTTPGPVNIPPTQEPRIISTTTTTTKKPAIISTTPTTTTTTTKKPTTTPTTRSTTTTIKPTTTKRPQITTLPPIPTTTAIAILTSTTASPTTTSTPEVITTTEKVATTKRTTTKPPKKATKDKPKTGDPNTINNSSSKSPACRNMHCFPPPDTDKCVETKISDCEILALLGSALECCPAFKCPGDSEKYFLQFGISDGLSESALNCPTDEKPSHEKPPTCHDGDEKEVSIDYIHKEGKVPVTLFDPKGQSKHFAKKEVRYVKGCEKIASPCQKPSGGGFGDKNCHRLGKGTVPKELKALGVSDACCGVWKCEGKETTMHYGFSRKPSVHIPFEYSGKNPEKLPKFLSIKESEPEPLVKSTKCPGVLCTPPLLTADCKVANSESIKAPKGSLRGKKECCPIWSCKKKDGGELLMYGRTSPKGYTKKDGLKSILVPSYFKVPNPYAKEDPENDEQSTTEASATEENNESQPPEEINIQEPPQQMEPPPMPINNGRQMMPPPYYGQDPMMAQMQAQNAQMMMANQAQMRSMQAANYENMRRMQGQPAGYNMGPPPMGMYGK